MNFTEPSKAERQEITQAVKLWRDVRATRLALEKEAATVRARETALRDFVVAAMRSQAYEGIVDGGRHVYVRTTEVPTASDRREFEEYILQTGSLDLLQFRPASGALKERREAGVVVPGIAWIETYDLGDKQA